MRFLEQSYLNNTIQDWLIAAGVFVLAALVLFLIRGVVIGRLQGLAKKTTTAWDDIILAELKNTRWIFLLSVAVFVATLAVVLPPTVRVVIDKIFILVLLLQVAVWGNGLIGQAIRRATRLRLEKNAAEATTMAALGFTSKLVLWTVVLLLGLDYLGFNITALVAGLGVGGIAVALALQNILGDLFASLSIVLDKPFVIGDFIVVDQYLGTVEYIGLKTTRLRSLSGEQIVFSNADLMKSRIRNYKRMQERRIVFSIGVTYQTRTPVLQKVPSMIRDIIAAQELARFDRAHFKEFGDSSLIFEIVYYMKSPEYNDYMDVQQRINLALCERFAAEGITFAYPTRTVYMQETGSAGRESPAVRKAPRRRTGLRRRRA